jgi:hypothetical protein
MEIPESRHLARTSGFMTLPNREHAARQGLSRLFDMETQFLARIVVEFRELRNIRGGFLRG